jgi:antitoxin component of RelBE/YafQ-DinJ toxin-antitoxin module
MNLTLAVDQHVVERARKVAESMGISLNQAIRGFLEDLAGVDSVERDLDELKALSKRSRGRSRGWRVNRDEIHARA